MLTVNFEFEQIAIEISPQTPFKWIQSPRFYIKVIHLGTKLKCQNAYKSTFLFIQ